MAIKSREAMILMIITVVIIAINIEGWLTVLSHVISTSTLLRQVLLMKEKSGKKEEKGKKKEIHRTNTKPQTSTTKRIRKHSIILNSRKINHFNFKLFLRSFIYFIHLINPKVL